MATHIGPIWLLLDSSGFGGIESHILQLSRGLLKHGITVKVVFMQRYGKHPLEALLNAQGTDVHINDHGTKGLLQQLRQQPPALVHTHGYKAGIVGRLLCALVDCPCISTFHAGERPQGKVMLYDWLDRHTAFLAQQLIAVSDAVAERLPGTSITMNNFVDCATSPPSDGEQLAFVGRLSEEKGPDLLARLGVGQKIDVYGDGPLRESLLASAPEHLVFHGQQQNMEPCWQAIGLLLMPSRFEGMPMAALESMARGIPVLAFAVGGLPRLIEHGVNGWLVPPGDTAAFSDYLQRWQALPTAVRQRMGDAARLTIQHAFSDEAVIPRYIALYQDTSVQHRLSA